MRRALLSLACAGVLTLMAGAASAAEGVFDEVRVGLFRHDAGVFGNNREDGVDFNGEIRFVSPSFLKMLGSPRPDLGFSVNSDGNTSQIYGGLIWTVFPFS